MRTTLAIVCLFAFLALVSCSQSKSGQRPGINRVPIKTGKVQKTQERQLVVVSGTVTSPGRPTEVTFLVSGKVTEVLTNEGDYVKKGQLLAAIDPTDYTLAFQGAEAKTRQAMVELNRAKAEYARMKFLYDTRSLAENDFEKFKAVFLSDKQVVAQAAANEKYARKRLTDASLHAPVAGFISRRPIQPGDTVSPTRPAFQIVNLDPIEVSVGVPETDVHLVKVGQKARITIPALPGKSFEGKVRVVNVSADPTTRTYLARIEVANPDRILRVGMVAQASIEADRTLTLMTLPADTILQDSQGATIVYIYYPKQNRAYAKRVETGSAYGREIEIKSGLSGDENIVFAGQDKLWDGAPVALAGKTGQPGETKVGQ
ncbi:MAG: efflux RND transporter periplasmic adaptor subunit [Syntrophobacteraceae bacterium]